MPENNIQPDMCCPARREISVLSDIIASQQKTIGQLTELIVQIRKTVTPADMSKEFDCSPKGILEFRHRYSITQWTLSKLIGVDQSDISRWETGEARPKYNKKLISLMRLEEEKLIELIAKAEAERKAFLEKRRANKPTRHSAKKHKSRKIKNVAIAVSPSSPSEYGISNLSDSSVSKTCNPPEP